VDFFDLRSGDGKVDLEKSEKSDIVEDEDDVTSADKLYFEDQDTRIIFTVILTGEEKRWKINE
jgi:hypothetical protein